MAEPDRDMLLRQFGGAVRAQRLVRGISQEELAFQAGLDRTYVGGIERGERNVSLLNISRLARALNISLSDLFAGLDTEPE